MAQETGKHRRRQRERDALLPATSRWEWAAAALGLVLVAGTLGYMGYYALAHRESPPSPSVTILDTQPFAGGGYLVLFEVANRGNGTAASLQILGELRRNGETIEQRETQIDFLPSFSAREGGLIFENDPQRYELVIAPGGYAKP